jgi:excisionase family DNA binding protein
MATISQTIKLHVPSLGEKVYFPMFINAVEAAKMLGVSRPTVLKMVENKELSSSRNTSIQGSSWRIDTISVLEFLGVDWEKAVVNV